MKLEVGCVNCNFVRPLKSHLQTWPFSVTVSILITNLVWPYSTISYPIIVDHNAAMIPPAVIFGLVSHDRACLFLTHLPHLCPGNYLFSAWPCFCPLLPCFCPLDFQILDFKYWIIYQRDLFSGLFPVRIYLQLYVSLKIQFGSCLWLIKC